MFLSEIPYILAPEAHTKLIICAIARVRVHPRASVALKNFIVQWKSFLEFLFFRFFGEKNELCS